MGDCVVPFLALVSSYGNHKHVCFGIWRPRGVSGYREKQGGRVLSRQLGCGLISLPGTGEALEGPLPDSKGGELQGPVRSWPASQPVPDMPRKPW